MREPTPTHIVKDPKIHYCVHTSPPLIPVMNLIVERYRYICYLQVGWYPVAVVEYTFTHKQYTEQHN